MVSSLLTLLLVIINIWCLGDYFHLASISKNSILSILKITQVLKAAGMDNLSGGFLKDGTKFLSKPIGDLCNLSITFKPLYEKGSLT